MWFICMLVVIFIDNFVIFDNDVFDIWVGMCGKMFLLCQFQCLCYVIFVLYGLVFQVCDFFVKFFDIFEIVVDRGKMDIGDFIEFF